MYRVSALLPRHLESLLSFLGSELPWDAPGQPVLGAGASWGLALLASPPTQGERRVITQLALPGRPPPIPHHLQPSSARNTLGLLPSTHGLQPRVLPQPPWPCPGPYGGAKVGAERGQQEEGLSPPAGCRGRWRNSREGAPSRELGSQVTPSSLSLPCFHLCDPQGCGVPARPTPVSLSLGLSQQGFQRWGLEWGGNRELREGEAGEGGGNSISRVGPVNSGCGVIRKSFL